MVSKQCRITIAALMAAVLPVGCSTGRFHAAVVEDTRLVPADGSIELSVDEYGNIQEVEYHISHSDVPAAVLQAADEKLPGGRITDCEKEYEGGKSYYEVTKEIDGLKKEVMFTPTGEVHLMELAIPSTDAPQDVLKAANAAVPGGTLKQVEQIRDADDQLVEYHVKKMANGMHYKILIAPDGALIRVMREVTAEIEVPVK